MLLHDVIDSAAASAPGHSALIIDRRTYTFAEVAADVETLAHAIAGVSAPGDTVALLAPNGYAYPLAYYAVPRAGRLLLLINQRLHPLEWVSQLERSRATVLIAEAELLAHLKATADLPPLVRTVVAVEGPGGDLSFDELLAAGTVATPATQPSATLPDVRPDDPAWLMYTSGTTGRPKGVLLTHRSLLAGVRHSMLLRPMYADDVFLTAFPLCHVAGYQVITAHLQRRPAVVLSRFDAEQFVAAVRDHDVSVCSLAPTMMDLLVEHLQQEPDSLHLVRERLRCIGYGSAPMPPALMRRVIGTLDCELNQGYGMTELAGNVTALGAADHRAAISDSPELLTSAGTPGPLATLAILEPSGVLAPTGVAGEIVVRGEQVCGGYHDDPQRRGIRGRVVSHRRPRSARRRRPAHGR